MADRSRRAEAAHDSSATHRTEATAAAALRQADEPALVQRCLDGDPRAFDVIVERHRRAVYQVCYRFVRNHEDASELAQDVFVRAYRGLRSFKRQASLATWLYRIAVNVSLTRVSVRTPVLERIQADQLQDDRTSDPVTEMLRSERAAAVRTAIAQLPRRQRTTVILRVYQELSHEQIANVLGTSVGAVKANVFHALANLRRMLTKP